VSSVDTTRDDDGNKRTYIDVACTAIVDTDTDADATAESESESEQADAEQTPADSEGESSPAESEPIQAGVQADVQDVADDIETAANLQGADPANLTLADVEDMAPALGDEHPDEVLEHAVESLSKESDSDGDGTAEDNGSGSDGVGTMDALEQCRSDGLFKCPADGCLVQVGEQGAFMDHVEDEHADQPAPEWVAEQVGA
jgi:hypothetical protein